MARVAVVGAGPSGAVFAARMAQLGHAVWLVERAVFPRSRLGESLSPGVLPLLDMIGARGEIEDAGFLRVRSAGARWAEEREERHESGPGGLLVDRGRFDALLLERARTLGVRVLQPAAIRERRQCADGWMVRVDTGGHTIELHADLVADAGGRSSALPGRRRMPAVRTVALHAYWRGAALPGQPRIEAGRDAWYWGVPLPDGRYNTLAFIDPADLRRRGHDSIASVFRRLIGASGLMAGCRGAALDGPVRAVDATPYVDQNSVTASTIKIGEAALALDPISSSGVQKAIQTALAGAVVANTLLRKPAAGEAAIQFYRSSLEESSARHRSWAAAHYAAAAATRPESAFWAARADGAVPDTTHASAPADPRPARGSFLEVSPLVRFVERPCIEGEFITVKAAVEHPSLDAPVAFLGGWELAPLLRVLRAGITADDVTRAWSDRLPMESSAAIAAWLLERRILIAAGSGQPAAGSRQSAVGSRQRAAGSRQRAVGSGEPEARKP